MNELDYAKMLLLKSFISQEEYERIESQYNYAANTSLEDSVQVLLDGFKNYLSTITDSSNTVNNYYNNVRSFLAYMYGVSTKDVGGCKSKQIKSSDINDYMLHKFNESNLTVSMSGARNSIRKFVEFINDTQDYKIKWEEIYDIGLVAKTLMKRKQEVDYVSESEVHDMVDNVDIKTATIILLGYEGALKRNELLNMRISDIDLVNGTYSVRDKDDIITRTLAASDKLIKVLKSYLMYLDDDIENSNNLRQSSGRPLRDKSDYLFQTRKSDKPSLYTIHYSIETSIQKRYKKSSMSYEDLKTIMEKFKNENLRQSRIIHYYILGYSQKEIDKLTSNTYRHYNATYRRMAEEIMRTMH